MVKEEVKKSDEVLYLVTFEYVKSLKKDSEIDTLRKFYLTDSFPNLLRQIADDYRGIPKSIIIEVVYASITRLVNE